MAEMAARELLNIHAEVFSRKKSYEIYERVNVAVALTILKMR